MSLTVTWRSVVGWPLSGYSQGRVETYRLKLGEEAQADIDDVLEWSLFRFGASVRDGYHALIRATFRGIAGDPELRARIAAMTSGKGYGQYI